MIEIALESDKEGIFQKDIAENQNLSVKYLDHIIAALKVAGLVTTFKGRKSGYKLNRDADLISMYDIHLAFEAGLCVIDCLREGTDCDRRKECAVIDFWDGLNVLIIDYLKSVSLAQLVSKKVSLMGIND
jgi:Rrf2 family protein